MHEGHRERLKRKFLADGIDKFERHEILELALFWAIPRRNTNDIAHKLIKKFGSLSAVFDAPLPMLKEIDGIGESAAVFLKLIPHLCREYTIDKNSSNEKNLNIEDACDKLVLKFIGRTEEVVALMLFDAKGKIVYEGVINKGTVNAVDLYARRIIELIVNYSACSAILAHNHPSGFATPSKSDINSTKKINQILLGMKVHFLDHLIVAEDDYISLRACNIDGLFE